MPEWLYWVLGIFVRAHACKCAAIALGHPRDADASYAPRLWSLAVFFEKYTLTGAEDTREEFGPKDPVSIVGVMSGQET